MFGVITGTFVYFIVDLSSDYSVTISNNYLDNYNMISEIQNKTVSPMEDQIEESGGIEEGSATDAVKFSSGAYASLKYITTLPTILNTLIGGIASGLGIPGFYVGAFIVIISIMIIFFIINAIFGRDL